MCGRYVLVQKTEILEQRFNITAPKFLEWKPNYNITPGTYAPVITSDKPRELQLFQFGLTPFWAKKPMYLFNARSEGDKNKENAFDYHGSLDIITKPAFRKPIRSQRCLVIADAFIEGTTNEGLDKPYLVFQKDKKRPFAFAGIYDTWLNAANGEIVESFAIITTSANALMQQIPHHRCPLILPTHLEKDWLNISLPLSTVTEMLQPTKSVLLNAYPISPKIKSGKENNKSLLDPIGDLISPNLSIKSSSLIELQGMGNRKKLS
jgi:putative SOS response-associated peptidase YedK